MADNQQRRRSQTGGKLPNRQAPLQGRQSPSGKTPPLENGRSKHKPAPAVPRARPMAQRAASQKESLHDRLLRDKRITPRQVGEMRLQKALALTGLGSRRDMDEAVSQGRVEVNGVVATPGIQVRPGDKVRMDGRNIFIKWPDRLPRVILYHKQEGELVSRDDPEGRVTVFERLPKVASSKWVAIGRLDFNTSGLLLFTTSGDLANRMMHPRFEVEREYAVRILGQLDEATLRLLSTGIQLDDGPARFARIEEQGGEGANHWYRVVIREGRNREVRRIFEAVGFTVSRLIRVRFGPVVLPSRLKRGTFHELPEHDVLALLRSAGLAMNGREID